MGTIWETLWLLWDVLEVCAKVSVVVSSESPPYGDNMDVAIYHFKKSMLKEELLCFLLYVASFVPLAR